MKQMALVWGLLIVAVMVVGCTPSEVVYMQTTMTAAVATATREAQRYQATQTAAQMGIEGTAAAAAAADAETRLLLYRATQTVIAAQTVQAVEGTRAAVETAEAQGTAEGRRLETERAFVREGWTATAQGEARQATAAEAARLRELEWARATGTREAQDAQGTGTAEYGRAAAAAGGTGTAQAVMFGGTAMAARLQADGTQAAAGAGIVAEQYRQEQILTEQADYGKYAWVVVAVLGSLAAIALVSYAAFNVARTRAVTQVVQRGALGEAPVVLIGNRAVMADRSLYPVADPGRPVLPPVEAQLRLAEGDTVVQGLRAAGHGPRAALPPVPVSVHGEGDEGDGEGGRVLPVEADWREFEGWNGQAFLLGRGQGGPVVFDPLYTPHLLVAATSGAGKSMTILRPLAARALASGYQVVLVNDAGGDFAPLGNHANLVRAGEGTAAAARALEAVAGEVDRRSQVLRDAGVSTWGRLPAGAAHGAPVMVMIDELVALAWEAEGELRRRIWQALIHVTSKGRKMAVTAVLATTDPTERTLGREGLTVRDNCARAVLQLRDAHVSRLLVSTDEATRLKRDQFLAVMSANVRLGMAYHPSDEQLAAYMASHPAQAVQGLALPGLETPALEKGETWEERAVRLWAGGPDKGGMAPSRVAKLIGRNYYDTLAALGLVGGSSSRSSSG